MPARFAPWRWRPWRLAMLPRLALLPAPAEELRLAVERFGRNLAENGIGTLAEFRARNQHANAAVGATFYAYDRTQITLARARKSGAV